MKKYTTAAFFLSLALVFPPSAQAQASFTVAGSGSNIPLTQKLLDAYAASGGARIGIPPSIGTAGAVKALLSNGLTLGLISRPLKDAEKAAGLKELPYARLGIVFGAHAGVPDADIGPEDLVAIYRGTKSVWSDGKMIAVLAREAGDSSNLVLERLVPGFKEALGDALRKKRWDVFYTDQDEFEATRNTMHSFGLVDTSAMTYLAPAVKALAFAGVEPTLANVESGRYPFWKDLAFAYRDPLPEEARRFLAFAASDAGAAVLRANGAVPLRGPAGAR
jgi:phosphate transport system substrate-binding protein